MHHVLRRHTLASPASTGFIRARLPRFRSLPWLAVLLALTSHMARASEVPVSHAAGDPAGATVASSSADHTSAIRAYAARAAALRTQALQTGVITYHDVIRAAYAPGAIDTAVLRAKAQWRATVGHGFTFITDYATFDEETAVEPLTAVADAALQSTLVAQYESVSHLIGLSPVATDFAIFHESGHALQRATLRAGGAAASERIDAPAFPRSLDPHTNAADAMAVHRLRYLCSPVEWEVRLQDLNRFHALLVAGRPILEPLDTLRALSALGLPLTYEETRDAFTRGGLTLSREVFEQNLATFSIEPATIAVAFEDARELCLVRSLTSRTDPTRWPDLLAKTIFEAPGHL